ncbi:HSP20-like chaperone [Rickenella mellea]|uniref:HSP20-like chaperone n=1 Tax=Rickenella mellea TaxID=50990 RepID=A0A4Y7QE14_9AGAM|nr:HSP20-like chaperone [Rickenella mellea]
MAAQYYYEPLFSFCDVDCLPESALASLVPLAAGDQTGDLHRHHSIRGHRRTKDNQPKMDVFESTKEQKVIAMIELPGMKKEDVILDIHNNRLIIHGKYPSHHEQEKEGYIVHERCEGKFTRVLPLSVGVKVDQIKASMENGVLQVTFPKPSSEQKASRIIIS